LSAIDKKLMLLKAIEAQESAICPYSNYPVGAALMVENNIIVKGFNIESKAYPTTICAERVAIFSALSYGYKQFYCLAVATNDGGTPCGSCRQIMHEFLGNVPIIISDSNGSYFETTTKELLPNPFG